MTHKILYLGQKPIGEKCFQILLDHEGEELEVCAVSSNTRLDTWWGTAKIYQKAKMQGISFISNTSWARLAVKDMILRHKIDTIISVQHPHIITPDVLQAVHYNAFNLHLAKLPEYRGYNAPNFAILNGDSKFYVTIHRTSDAVDAGDIVAESWFPIEKDDTALSLYKKSEDEGSALFEQFVKYNLLQNKLEGRPQQGKSCYHGHGSLDAVREIKHLREVECKARALYFPPWEPAYFKINSKKYYILPEWKL